MFNDYQEVSPVEEIYKVLEIIRYSPKHEIIQTNRYFVFPKGNLNVSQNSQSAAKKLNLTLAVIGVDIGNPRGNQ